MSEEIIRFQELAHNAWLAKDNILYKGWILRQSEGVTRRANSVLTVRYFGNDVQGDIESVETLYESRNLPIIFQIASYYQPENLIEILQSLKYKSEAETLVMSRSLNEHTSLEIDSKIDYITEVGVTDEWFNTLKFLSNSTLERIEGIKRIVSRNHLGKVVCYAKNNDSAVGTVLGIVQGQSMGIYNLIVSREYRRQGIGKNIMIKTINWAKDNKIKEIYLAVEKENISAISLYEKLGFSKKFNYKYYLKKSN